MFSGATFHVPKLTVFNIPAQFLSRHCQCVVIRRASNDVPSPCGSVRPSSNVSIFHSQLVVSGLPGGIFHVPQLLPRTAFRRAARLHVPAPAVPHPVPHAESPVRLHVRLDAAEAEDRSAAGGAHGVHAGAAYFCSGGGCGRCSGPA